LYVAVRNGLPLFNVLLNDGLEIFCVEHDERADNIINRSNTSVLMRGSGLMRI
jgi:hypothetical protein